MKNGKTILEASLFLVLLCGLILPAVVAEASDDYNHPAECDVGDWTDIIEVAAGSGHTVGLKSDGTVVAVGGNWEGQCDVGNWIDITRVAAGCLHTLGLKADDTVIAVGDNHNGQCNVEGWTDIKQVAAGFYHTVGLKADGTVVAAGENEYGQCDVEGWADITQVAAGFYHTVGLKDDGTVVAVGANYDGECDVEGWTDIIQVAAGDWHTLGLKSNGTVVAVGGAIPDGVPEAGCFIATAAYGTPMAEDIQVLRDFRDEYLLTSPLGQALVGIYYRVSPPMAEFMAEHPSLKPVVRAGLLPVAAMSTVVVNTTPAEKMAMVGSLVLVSVTLAVWAKRRRGRGPQYT